MGYVAFAVIVAAGGALVLWLWWRHYRLLGRMPSFGRARYAANGLPFDPIPPLKKTISGPSERDRERWAFEEQIEAWQKSFRSRGDHNDTNPHVLKGNAYHYVPQARKGNEVSTSA
jgi:hypothetical protein